MNKSFAFDLVDDVLRDQKQDGDQSKVDDQNVPDGTQQEEQSSLSNNSGDLSLVYYEDTCTEALKIDQFW